jgi:hypothetical protein
MEPLEFDRPRTDDKATFEAAYQEWLRNPVTKEVFRRLERMGRPQPTRTDATGEAHAYTNGIVWGYWHAIDLARALDQIQAMSEVKQPTPDYAGGNK